MRIVKAPMPNIEAIQDAVFKISQSFTVHFTGTNGIYINTDRYEMTVDDILSINFRLYGVHNRLKVHSNTGCLHLYGATYWLLPEFLIEGEEVEFPIND